MGAIVFAQSIRTWTLADIGIAVIFVAALVAIVFVALNAMKIQIPQWALQVAGIVAVAFVCIIAIKFLLMM
jgi:hypothetical protein